jgi:hypothetical protein
MLPSYCTEIRSEILMLFKYLKRSNMKLEQKWHLIIHSCQIFAFVEQKLRQAAASLVPSLIQGSTETGLKIYLFKKV